MKCIALLHANSQTENKDLFTFVSIKKLNTVVMFFGLKEERKKYKFVFDGLYI